MTGVEINMVVADSTEALRLYERIFEVERIEVAYFPKGLNEAVFLIYGTRFHLLDESPEFQMIAPKFGESKPVWVNIAVPDIVSTYAKAMKAGCTEIQPVVEIPDFGISNAVFSDPFGHIWMLHQIHKVVSFDERMRLMREQIGKY